MSSRSVRDQFDSSSSCCFALSWFSFSIFSSFSSVRDFSDSNFGLQRMKNDFSSWMMIPCEGMIGLIGSDENDFDILFDQLPVSISDLWQCYWMIKSSIEDRSRTNRRSLST